MAASQVSVGGAVRYAWTLLSSNWRAIWGVLALNALAATVWAAGDLTRNPTLLIGAAPALLMTSLMVCGALYRIAFADRHADDPKFRPGHHGLQWGAIEWRLLGASLLSGAFIGMITLLVLLALSAVLAGVLLGLGVQPRPGMTMDQVFGPLGLPPATAPVVIVTILLAVATYLGVRLALVLPATTDEKAVRVLRTWKLTRGHVWPIFAAALFVQLPVLILSGWMAANIISMSGTPADVGPTALLMASLAVGAPMGFFVTPMMAAINAFFYRVLSQAAPAAGVRR